MNTKCNEHWPEAEKELARLGSDWNSAGDAQGVIAELKGEGLGLLADDLGEYLGSAAGILGTLRGLPDNCGPVVLWAALDGEVY